MARSNILVKLSGSLLEKNEVLEWLKSLGNENYVVISIGGGNQINQAFIEAGFKIQFSPLGRICETLEEKQLARNALEKNQAFIQDQLDERGINARVIIPVLDIATVLCHVNGDLLALALYSGFDKIYLLTVKERIEEKEQWLEKVAQCFAHIERSKLNKIEVKGF
jgi:hypothetical protein